MTSTRGRRGAVTAASAAVVCLAGILAACGDGAGGGYVAVGPAGGSPRAPGRAVPTGAVTLVPLDGGGQGGDSGVSGGQGSPGADNSPVRDGSRPSGGTDSGTASGGSGPGGSTGATGAAPSTGNRGANPAPTDGSSPGSPSSPGNGNGGGNGRTTSPKPPSPPSPPSSPAPPPSSAPPTPARLSAGEPVREAADRRWCEKVTVTFRNSGGTAVRSGTVTLGTHIIGALGIDWGTVESSEPLPAPIGAGARKDGSWTVCVDAWRVPLGMHIETRDVAVQWK
ncbi:hypothetical protein [Streptomyces anandii]